MITEIKTVVIFAMLSTCALSYYMPHMTGHYPLPHWAPFYNNWPVPFVNPAAYQPYVPRRRLDPELADGVQKLLEAKRTEVIDRLDDVQEFDEFENETVPISSRARRPLLLNRRPGLFSNLKLPQLSIKNNLFNGRLSGLATPQISPQDNDLARFLYIGAGNVGTGNSANYLFKTSYVFSSAVATLCVVSTCIPANQFTTGGSTITCRRKRSLEKTYDDEIIEPSNVERLDVEPTALPESSSLETFTMYPTASESPQNSEAVLNPSFTISEDEDALDSNLSRKKRFLFIVTTTVTTYSFVTSTYTYRLTLYSNTLQGITTGLLTCRPSNIGLC